MAPMMKRFTGLLNRSKSQISPSDPDIENSAGPSVDSPEANAPRAIRLFCDTPSTGNSGEEVLHLPVIVESAESSPAAAASAAYQIRKFLSKEYAAKPHVQYNAIMLIRILSDNPGPSFTKNFDAKFVSAVKELLRNGRDPSTQQMMRETLDSLEVDKSWDEGLGLLLQMWRKEKGSGAVMRSSRSTRVSQSMANAGFGSVPPQDQGYAMSGGQGRRGKTLPSPAELASRVEEAKNTAKILLQLVQSTPTEEMLSNDLIKEFSQRCSTASRSMHGYIDCDNPPPDHDTMQTLIETNEQLSLAMSRHQRAVLAARRALGVNPSPNEAATAQESNGYSVFAPPPTQQQPYSGAPQLPPVAAVSNGFDSNSQQPQQQRAYEGFQAPPGPPPGMQSSLQQRQSQPHPEPENPFADPVPQSPTHYGAFAQSQHQSPQRQQPSQTFNIESENPYPAAAPRRQNTADLENAYSDPESRPSPTFQRNSIVDGSQRGSIGGVSGIGGTYIPPTSQQSSYNYADGGLSAQAAPAGPLSATAARPGPGPWHNSDVTPSYMGRQASAANGLTMHGAGSNDPPVPEIDGHSQVGRRDRDRQELGF